VLTASVDASIRGGRVCGESDFLGGGRVTQKKIFEACGDEGARAIDTVGALANEVGVGGQGYQREPEDQEQREHQSNTVL